MMLTSQQRVISLRDDLPLRRRLASATAAKCRYLRCRRYCWARWQTTCPRQIPAPMQRSQQLAARPPIPVFPAVQGSRPSVVRELPYFAGVSRWHSWFSQLSRCQGAPLRAARSAIASERSSSQRRIEKELSRYLGGPTSESTAADSRSATSQFWVGLALFPIPSAIG